MNNEIKNRIVALAKTGDRLDGRKLDQFRELDFEYDLSVKSEGSCMITAGGTKIAVGIKLGLGHTYDDTPDKGNLIVNGEMTPVAASDFEAGPPNEDEIAMSRVVDRGIRESGAIDYSKLVIDKDTKRCWEMFIDFLVFDYDGNAIDIAGIGALACLKQGVFPKYDKKEDKLVMGEKTTKKLPLVSEPVPITVVKIDEFLLVDPVRSELECSDAYVTITVDENDKIVSLQKRGSSGFSASEFEKALKMATSISKKIRKLIK